MIDASELRTYLDELWGRMPAFSKYAAGLPAEERGSLEWLAAAGRFWWSAREDAGLSRDEAARALRCSVNRLRLMEYGIVAPGAFGSRRLRQYAECLGAGALYDRFHDHYER